MVMQVLQPQELEVRYVRPTRRKELAKQLKVNGKSQKEIAQLFGLTEAAVSQYINDKRGTDVSFTPELQKIIKDAATRITDNITFIRETQQLAGKVWKDRFICTVCHDQNGSAIPKGCAVCFE